MTYKTIKERAGAQYTVSKSRFIAWAYPVCGATEAEEVLLSLRKEHAFATHICYAFITQDAVKSSDDGEPKGTAGAPILEVLKKGGLTNVLVAVVRYFGGVKLGAGGLVRAYGRAAADALAEAETITMEKLKIFRVSLDFSAAAKISLLRHGVVQLREYGGLVTLTIAARSGEELAAELAESAGREVSLSLTGEEWVAL